VQSIKKCRFIRGITGTWPGGWQYGLFFVCERDSVFSCKANYSPDNLLLVTAENRPPAGLLADFFKSTQP